MTERKKKGMKEMKEQDEGQKEGKKERMYGWEEVKKEKERLIATLSSLYFDGWF